MAVTASELDRRLQEIQRQLLPDEEAPPPIRFAPPEEPPTAPPAAPAPPAAVDPELVRAIAELLRAATGLLQREAPPGAATVSAGPFASSGAVERFANRLRGLPGVQEVSLRGYEGRDRALLEVRLTP